MARLMRPVLALFLLAFGCGSVFGGPPQPPWSTQAATQQESFAAFWPGFRAILLAGDMDQLSRLAQFPLEVRGVLDSDPIRRISRSQFSTVIAAILAEQSGLSATRPETNRTLIDHLPRVDPTQRGVSIGADTARVGPFGFARRAAEWRLVHLYREDDN